MSSTPNKKHPLLGLIAAQFFGVFNDNAWKLIVALMAIKAIGAEVGTSGPAFEGAVQAQTALAFVTITLPLIVVSIFAGVLADRFSKRSIIIAMKGAEILLMAAATFALATDHATGVVPLTILALMGAHSAIFSPAKYGILPELLPHERLTKGNSLLELWTFLAIIVGTVGEGLLLGIVGASVWLAGLVLTLLAVAGFFCAWAIPPVQAARAGAGIGNTLAAAWNAMRDDRVLRLAVMGLAFYWTVASLVGQDILVFAKAVLRLSDSLAGIPMTVFAIGIAAGALLAARLSGGKVEYGLIPLGALGLAAFLLMLGRLPPSLPVTLTLMALMGTASGFLIVPLNALLQWRAPHDRRGAVIALNNTFIFLGVLAGSLSGDALARLHFSTADILVAAALATAGGTLWALWLVPDAFIRLLLVLATHTLYRLRVVGRINRPADSGALLVPNHVSFVDGFLLIASLDRPVRFLVDKQYAERPLVRPLAKIMGVIPIAAGGSPREILNALREAGRQLDAGELVCIFPEGQITRTGGLLPFRKGFQRIVKGRHAPIVPVHLDRIWGSIFSFIDGRFVTKWPSQIPYPVTVSFGQPLPTDTPVADVRQAIQELGEAAWRLRKPSRKPLHRQFIRAMRLHPLRFAFADGSRPHVTALKALTGVIVMARALRPHWAGQERVGLLLPPSVAGVLVNIAAALGGRTSVNLNYTAGKFGMEAASRQAGLKTVVTSRLFLEKAKLDLPDGVAPIYLEDIASVIGMSAKITAMLLALLAPARLLEILAGAAQRPTVDDLATIIFSSGSTGEPKGVMLSHSSIDANVEGISQVFHIGPQDRILGILPFFHSFGYLVTIWFAAIHGAGVVYHPTPLDAVVIGNLAQKFRVTLMIATPTFLQLYLRRCTPDQFGSIRVVLTGAEKLHDRLAQAFEDKFGLRPIEGYGVTECSPVIACNVLDYRAAGFHQPGSRRGTVGQPLPGVTVRIVNPDTYERLPTGTPGMLLVKGSNVMNGYLNRPDLTEKAMKDGWYITGDIAMMDEDGFIRITDRLSRFSKIGGEMVPHGKVEDALQQAAGADTQAFAVTAVPDEKKGEQLAVLYTIPEAQIAEVLEKLSASGLPHLFIPKKDNFIKVDAIPILGTGKLDLRAIKKVAQERLGITAT